MQTRCGESMVINVDAMLLPSTSFLCKPVPSYSLLSVASITPQCFYSCHVRCGHCSNLVSFHGCSEIKLTGNDIFGIECQLAFHSYSVFIAQHTRASTKCWWYKIKFLYCHGLFYVIIEMCIYIGVFLLPIQRIVVQPLSLVINFFLFLQVLAAMKHYPEMCLSSF